MSDVKYYTPAGSSIKPVYSAKVRDDGVIELVQTGEEDIQEFIDSFAEETCISSIVARCAAGDTSVLSKRQGTYGDFSDFPKTYRDVLQVVIDGRNYFDSLPVEIKDKFNQSFEQWFTTYGTEDWFNAMGIGVVDPISVSEVKAVEPEQ